MKKDRHATVIAIAAFVLCIEASGPIPGFIPAAFLGAGTWIGANGSAPFAVGHLMVIVAMIVGGLLGSGKHPLSASGKQLSSVADPSNRSDKKRAEEFARFFSRSRGYVRGRVRQLANRQPSPLAVCP